MRSKCVSASVKTAFCVFLRMALQCTRFLRVSASVKTAFTFSLVWCHNGCVSHECLHLLGRLSRFPWYGVTMHAFHTLVGIYKNGFCVFLRITLQYMRFTRVSTSVKMTSASAFSVVWRYNPCVSQACLHRLKRLMRFPWYGITMHAYYTLVRIY